MAHHKMVFVNKNTGREYEILSLTKQDDGSQTVKLKGPTASWDEPYDAEKFKKLGYRLEKREVVDEAADEV